MLYLVRHGRALAGFGEHPDPGLDALGRQQAGRAAARLLQFLAEPLADRSSTDQETPNAATGAPPRIFSSPLARAQETAAAFSTLTALPIVIEPRIAEIPSPPAMPLRDRAAWLGAAMAGRWQDLPPSQRAWFADLKQCLLKCPPNSVLFSHFVAINAAVGHAMGDDRMVHFRPDNASITRLDIVQGRLQVVELGAEATTEVR